MLLVNIAMAGTLLMIARTHPNIWHAGRVHAAFNLLIPSPLAKLASVGDFRVTSLLTRYALHAGEVGTRIGKVLLHVFPVPQVNYFLTMVSIIKIMTT